MRDQAEWHSNAVPAEVAGVLSGVSGFPGACAQPGAWRHLNRHILRACACGLLLLCTSSASAQQGLGIYNPQKGRQSVRRANSATGPRRMPIRTSITQNGKSCNTIDRKSVV